MNDAKGMIAALSSYGLAVRSSGGFAAQAERLTRCSTFSPGTTLEVLSPASSRRRPPPPFFSSSTDPSPSARPNPHKTVALPPRPPPPQPRHGRLRDGGERGG